MSIFRLLCLAFSASLYMACAGQVSETEASSPEKTSPTLEDFIGVYSVYGACPKYDWNTVILGISQDYISMTETGCQIKQVIQEPSINSLLLELEACHAEGEPVPNERARLSISNGIKTLQYLPNKDGVLLGDGRVFKLTPCTPNIEE